MLKSTTLVTIKQFEQKAADVCIHKVMLQKPLTSCKSDKLACKMSSVWLFVDAMDTVQSNRTCDRRQCHPNDRFFKKKDKFQNPNNHLIVRRFSASNASNGNFYYIVGTMTNTNGCWSISFSSTSRV
jgi:predicted transcriptional regulator